MLKPKRSSITSQIGDVDIFFLPLCNGSNVRHYSTPENLESSFFWCIIAADMTQKKRSILILALGVFAGFLLTRGYFIFLKPMIKGQHVAYVVDGPVRLNKDYKLVNPLLFCGVSENKEFTEFKPLKNKVGNLITKDLKNNQAD